MSPFRPRLDDVRIRLRRALREVAEGDIDMSLFRSMRKT